MLQRQNVSQQKNGLKNWWQKIVYLPNSTISSKNTFNGFSTKWKKSIGDVLKVPRGVTRQRSKAMFKNEIEKNKVRSFSQTKPFCTVFVLTFELKLRINELIRGLLLTRGSMPIGILFINIVTQPPLFTSHIYGGGQQNCMRVNRTS